MSTARDLAAAIVRPFRESDLEQVLGNVEVVAAEGRWIGTEAPVDREWWGQHIERGIAGGGAHFVVEVGGRVVGSGGLTQVIPGLFDLGMFLLPEWRGRGLGRALVAEMVAWARAHGAYKIALQVWPHNTAAIALYESFGFEREGYLRRQWRRRNGEIWDAVVMGLIIDDASPR